MSSEAAPWQQGLGTEHEGPPWLAQPFENTVFQRGTGFLIIPWSLVRIQAGPVLQTRPFFPQPSDHLYNRQKGRLN